MSTNLRINEEIRAAKVRVVDQEGNQLGVLSVREAIERAQEAGVDLVEIAPNAVPPVCKIIDYGKYRYDQTKREKESKKSQHQIKVKEVKVKPNIDQHDLDTKMRQARDFLTKGNKVKITCMLRGREMIRPEIADKVVSGLIQALADVSLVEAPPKMLGRIMSATLAPGGKKKVGSQAGIAAEGATVSPQQAMPSA